MNLTKLLRKGESVQKNSRGSTVKCIAYYKLKGEFNMKNVIATDKAPGAIGPYSQAIKVGNFLFTSGQIAIDPAKGQMVEGGVAAQAEQVMKNLKGVLEGAGYTFADVVKTTVFAKSMGDFAVVNEIYAKSFSENPPARSFVEVAALPKSALVEVEVVAYKD